MKFCRFTAKLKGRSLSVPLGSGSCLSSHAVSSTVLSVYVGLTSVFGMRTGGTPQLNHRKSFTGEKHLDRLDVFPCAQCVGWLRISRPAGPLKPLVSQYLDNCIRNVNSLRSSPRPISIAQLRTLLHFHLRPINHVVFMGSYSLRMGDLILKSASRLDAFSVYPIRTWLPSCAVGTTTDTPLVRPSRSSRTEDSSSQISCAHDG